MLCFYLKQDFGPRAAKSQPIWIKFCIHLLLHGIHFWTNLDRDRWRGRLQSLDQTKTTVFVILVTHPKSYIRDVPNVSFKRLNDNYRLNVYKIKR